MMPTQVRRPQPNRTATAPYNFVPLPEGVIAVVYQDELRECKTADERSALLDKRLPSHDRYSSKRYSGQFEVVLKTLAPLYVRGMLSTTKPNDNTESEFARAEAEKSGHLPDNFREAAKNTARFFYTRDPNQPVIPGSSLRGMLRGLLEIASYGKMTRVTDKKWLSGSCRGILRFWTNPPPYMVHLMPSKPVSGVAHKFATATPREPKKLIYRAVGDSTALGAWYREQVLGPNQTTPPNMFLDYPSFKVRGGYLCRHEGK
jgi:hypothetical protein